MLSVMASRGCFVIPSLLASAGTGRRTRWLCRPCCCRRAARSRFDPLVPFDRPWLPAALQPPHVNPLAVRSSAALATASCLSAVRAPRPTRLPAHANSLHVISERLPPTQELVLGGEGRRWLPRSVFAAGVCQLRRLRSLAVSANRPDVRTLVLTACRAWCALRRGV